VELAFWALKMC